MKLNWSFKLILIVVLLTGGVFVSSPYIAARALSQSAEKNDIEKWQSLVNADYFQQYTTKIMDGLLRVKMAIETKNPAIGRGMAMQDFTFARGAVSRKSSQMASTTGFAHLLCAEVARYPDFPMEHDSECWALDGEVQWQSLTRVEVRYKNPQSGWLTRLYLQRIGLFNWQAVDIELPVDEMVKQLEKQLLENV